MVHISYFFIKFFLISIQKNWRNSIITFWITYNFCLFLLSMKNFEEIDYKDFKESKFIKLVEKYLKKKYYWITRIDAENPENLNQYEIIFIKIYIDPNKLIKWVNLPKSDFFDYFTSRGEDGKDPLLQDFHYINYIVNTDNEPEDFARKFNSNLSDEIYELSQNPVIPDEFKLPGNRRLLLGNYQIDPKIFF